MELILNSVSTDISYKVSFKEAQLSIIKDRPPLPLVELLLKNFGLRLNDIKFNTDLPSNNFIHFSRFFGTTFFDVSFGIEEIEATIRNPEQKEQVNSLLGTLSSLLNQDAISGKRLQVFRQIGVKGDINEYLESLNPYCPEPFQMLIAGRGVFYTLRVEDHGLTIHITLTNSLYVPNGLYLYLDFQFEQNQLNFNELYGIVKSRYEFILKSLNLKVQSE